MLGGAEGAAAGVTAYQTAPEPEYIVDVTGFTERAVESLAEHRQYLSVLDPATPVKTQARAQVYRSVARSREDNRVHFRLMNQS